MSASSLGSLREQRSTCGRNTGKKKMKDQQKELEDVALKVYQLIKENGGVTISLEGKQPTEGFVYSPSKETEVVIPDEEFTLKAVDDFKNKNAGLLNQDGNHIGGWQDGGRTYIDVSRVGEPSAKTLDAAQRANQLGVYDLRTSSTIITGKIENGVYNKTDEATNLFDKYQRENPEAINEGSNAGIQKIPSGEGAGTGISRIGKGIVVTCRAAYRKVLKYAYPSNWVRSRTGGTVTGLVGYAEPVLLLDN